MSLSSKAVRGVQWTTSSTIITSVLQIGYTSIMSRLLDPSAFGLLAAAQIFLNFGSYFSRMGMSQAIIQKKELSQEDIRSAFTFSFVIAFIFASLIWLTAPLSNLVFTEINSDVVPIIRVLAVNFLIGSISTIPTSLLRREMKFKTIAIIEIISYSIAFMIIGVVFGFLGFGVWSLVIANVSSAILVTIFSYLSYRHPVIPIFKWKYYKPFLQYGSVISITTFVDFLGTELPLIFIGRYFGDYKLGIFRQAYFIVNIPLTKLSFSVQNVAFSMYSSMQTELARLSKAYLTSITLMSIILIPISLGMSVAAKEITLVVLGMDFIESYPILAVLCIGISFKFLSRFAGVVCDATAQLKAKFYIQLVYLVGLIVAAYMLKDYGLIGFAWIMTVGEFLKNIAFIILTSKILKITFKQHVKAYYSGMVIGVVTAVSIYLVTILMNKIAPILVLKLLVQMGVGAIAIVYFVLINPMSDIREIIKDHFLKLNFFSKGKGKFVLNHLSWYKNDK